MGRWWWEVVMMGSGNDVGFNGTSSFRRSDNFRKGQYGSHPDDVLVMYDFWVVFLPTGMTIGELRDLTDSILRGQKLSYPFPLFLNTSLFVRLLCSFISSFYEKRFSIFFSIYPATRTVSASASVVQVRPELKTLRLAKMFCTVFSNTFCKSYCWNYSVTIDWRRLRFSVLR